MTFGNKAVRDHAAQGRALRLFEKQGSTSSVRYPNEFDLPDEAPWIEADALGTDEQLRSLFVFRLRPVGDAWGAPQTPTTAQAVPPLMPLEAGDVESYVQDRSTESAVYLRREAVLVGRYTAWLAKQGRTNVERHRIPTPAGPSMYTDLVDHSRKLLIEAKASGMRQDIRLAFGQVLDYARFVDHDRLAVLLPTEPPADLVKLLASHGVGMA